MDNTTINNLISLQDIKNHSDYGNEFFAICDNNKQYDASFNRELNVMFFCIPSSINVLGYLQKIA